uniref:N-acetyltransferase domain-containing protein n=1 Tax=viral metagenome TaxID=1070528 RepID=A0A6C0HSU8_9ZZZZ
MLIFEKNLVENGVKWEKVMDVICGMAKKLNEQYIYELFANNYEVILYSIDTFVDIDNCPCGLIYKIEESESGTNIYIMFIATQYRFRKVGYASIFIKEFIDFIKGKYTNVTIVLDSVESAVTFYEHNGFQWSFDEKYNEVFGVDENNMHEHIIMVLKTQ